MLQAASSPNFAITGSSLRNTLISFADSRVSCAVNCSTNFAMTSTDISDSSVLWTDSRLVVISGASAEVVLTLANFYIADSSQLLGLNVSFTNCTMLIAEEVGVHTGVSVLVDALDSASRFFLKLEATRQGVNVARGGSCVQLSNINNLSSFVLQLVSEGTCDVVGEAALLIRVSSIARVHDSHLHVHNSVLIGNSTRAADAFATALICVSRVLLGFNFHVRITGGNASLSALGNTTVFAAEASRLERTTFVATALSALVHSNQHLVSMPARSSLACLSSTSLAVSSQIVFENMVLCAVGARAGHATGIAVMNNSNLGSNTTIRVSSGTDFSVTSTLLNASLISIFEGASISATAVELVASDEQWRVTAAQHADGVVFASGATSSNLSLLVSLGERGAGLRVTTGSALGVRNSFLHISQGARVDNFNVTIRGTPLVLSAAHGGSTHMLSTADDAQVSGLRMALERSNVTLECIGVVSLLSLEAASHEKLSVIFSDQTLVVTTSSSYHVILFLGTPVDELQLGFFNCVVSLYSATHSLFVYMASSGSLAKADITFDGCTLTQRGDGDLVRFFVTAAGSDTVVQTMAVMFLRSAYSVRATNNQGWLFSFEGNVSHIFISVDHSTISMTARQDVYFFVLRNAPNSHHNRLSIVSSKVDLEVQTVGAAGVLMHLDDCLLDNHSLAIHDSTIDIFATRICRILTLGATARGKVVDVDVRGSKVEMISPVVSLVFLLQGSARRLTGLIVHLQDVEFSGVYVENTASDSSTGISITSGAHASVIVMRNVSAALQHTLGVQLVSVWSAAETDVTMTDVRLTFFGTRPAHVIMLLSEDTSGLVVTAHQIVMTINAISAVYIAFFFSEGSLAQARIHLTSISGTLGGGSVSLLVLQGSQGAANGTHILLNGSNTRLSTSVPDSISSAVVLGAPHLFNTTVVLVDITTLIATTPQAAWCQLQLGGTVFTGLRVMVDKVTVALGSAPVRCFLGLDLSGTRIINSSFTMTAVTVALRSEVHAPAFISVAHSTTIDGLNISVEDSAISAFSNSQEVSFAAIESRNPKGFHLSLRNSSIAAETVESSCRLFQFGSSDSLLDGSVAISTSTLSITSHLNAAAFLQLLSMSETSRISFEKSNITIQCALTGYIILVDNSVIPATAEIAFHQVEANVTSVRGEAVGFFVSETLLLGSLSMAQSTFVVDGQLAANLLLAMSSVIAGFESRSSNIRIHSKESYAVVLAGIALWTHENSSFLLSKCTIDAWAASDGSGTDNAGSHFVGIAAFSVFANATLSLIEVSFSGRQEQPNIAAPSALLSFTRLVSSTVHIEDSVLRATSVANSVALVSIGNHSSDDSTVHLRGTHFIPALVSPSAGARTALITYGAAAHLVRTTITVTQVDMHAVGEGWSRCAVVSFGKSAQLGAAFSVLMDEIGLRARGCGSVGLIVAGDVVAAVSGAAAGEFDFRSLAVNASGAATCCAANVSADVVLGVSNFTGYCEASEGFAVVEVTPGGSGASPPAGSVTVAGAEVTVVAQRPASQDEYNAGRFALLRSIRSGPAASFHAVFVRFVGSVSGERFGAMVYGVGSADGAGVGHSDLFLDRVVAEGALAGSVLWPASSAVRINCSFINGKRLSEVHFFGSESEEDSGAQPTAAAAAVQYWPMPLVTQEKQLCPLSATLSQSYSRSNTDTWTRSYSPSSSASHGTLSSSETASTSATQSLTSSGGSFSASTTGSMTASATLSVTISSSRTFPSISTSATVSRSAATLTLSGGTRTSSSSVTVTATGTLSGSLSSSVLAELPWCGNATLLFEIFSTDEDAAAREADRRFIPDSTHFTPQVSMARNGKEAVDTLLLEAAPVHVFLYLTNTTEAQWASSAGDRIHAACVSSPECRTDFAAALRARPIQFRSGSANLVVATIGPLGRDSLVRLIGDELLTFEVGARAVACSNLRPAAQQVQVPLRGRPSPQLVVAERAATAMATVAAIGAGAAPGLAADAQALAAFSLISCGSSENRYVMKQAHMLLGPIALGPEPEGFVWGNILIVGLVFVASMLVAGLRFLSKRSLGLHGSLTFAGFPSRFYSISMFFHQGTAVLALRLVFDGRWSAAAFLGTLIALLLPVAIFFTFRVKLRGDWTDQDTLAFFRYETSVFATWPSNWMSRFVQEKLFPKGRWGPAAERKRFGGPLTNVLPTLTLYATVPLIQALVVAFVAAVHAGSTLGCTMQFATLAALYTTFAVGIWVLRPLRIPFLNAAQGLSHALLAAILTTSALMAQRGGVGRSGGWARTLLSVLIAAQTALSLVRLAHGLAIKVGERCFWSQHATTILWNGMRDNDRSTSRLFFRAFGQSLDESELGATTPPPPPECVADDRGRKEKSSTRHSRRSCHHRDSACDSSRSACADQQDDSDDVLRALLSRFPWIETASPARAHPNRAIPTEFPAGGDLRDGGSDRVHPGRQNAAAPRAPQAASPPPQRRRGDKGSTGPARQTDPHPLL